MTSQTKSKTDKGKSALAAAAPVHRSRVRTRNALLVAGQRLFATKPLEGVSIDDIVAAADVAKGSFYNHFTDKEGLADAIVELVQRDFEHEIALANDNVADAASRITRALAVMINYARLHPDRFQAMLNLTKRHTNPEAPLNAGVASDIRSGLKSKRFNALTVETGVLVVLGLISITVNHLMMSESSTPPRELASEMGAAILRALGMSADESARVARQACADLLTRGR